MKTDYLNNARMLLSAYSEEMNTDVFSVSEIDSAVKQLVKVLLLLHASQEMGEIVYTIAKRELQMMMDMARIGRIDNGLTLSEYNRQWMEGKFMEYGFDKLIEDESL